MELIDLFKGIAVIIDNEIENPNARISKIILQLNSLGIPNILFKSLPSSETISNFTNLSFLLLDWDLTSDQELIEGRTSGIIIPDGLNQSNIQENIEFIRKFRKICFCPIFIFSEYDIDNISHNLSENGIFSIEKPNNILIKSKRDLIGRLKLKKTIEEWVLNNSSVYILKEWEIAFQKSRNTLFSEFLEYSQNWPKILWKNFGNDGVNKSSALIELINQNLLSRIAPVTLNKIILEKRKRGKSTIQEIRNVLEGQIYIKEKFLDSNQISTGDLFKCGSEYYLNIRASCDLFVSRDSETSNDGVVLYLIRGEKLPEGKTNKNFDKKYGHFREIENQALVFPVDDGKVIDFRFTKIFTPTWGEKKTSRIGRILPPQITKIQQKYAHYFHRQGLTRIPHEAIH